MSALHVITEVGRYQMIFVKITTGIRQHFQIRLSEWLMVAPYFGLAWGMYVQPDMFDISASFIYLAQWADEATWGTLLFFCGIARLAALVVNGSFDRFKYSPHIRMAASLLGALFWSQFSLGFLQSYIAGIGAFSAVIAYGTFTVFELANFYRSSRDVGYTYSDIRKRQQHNGLGI
jgi:hypothetical protein